MKKYFLKFLSISILILTFVCFVFNTVVSAEIGFAGVSMDADSLLIPKDTYTAGESVIIESSFTQTGIESGVVRIDITNNIKLSDGSIIYDDTTFPWELVVSGEVKDRIFVAFDSNNNRLDHYFYILQDIDEKTPYSIKINIPNDLDAKYQNAVFNIDIEFFDLQSSNDAMYSQPGFLTEGWEALNNPDNLKILPKASRISPDWFNYTVYADGSFLIVLDETSKPSEPNPLEPDSSEEPIPSESGYAAPKSNPNTGDIDDVWVYIVCFMMSVMIISIMRKFQHCKV